MDWGNDIGCCEGGSSEKVGGSSGKLDSCEECCSVKCKSVGTDRKNEIFTVVKIILSIIINNYSIIG